MPAMLENLPTTEEEEETLLEEWSAWLASDEGQEAMKVASEGESDEVRFLNEARRIDPRNLQLPFDL